MALTPIGQFPFVGFSNTLIPGNTVALTPQPASNTWQIQVLNTNPLGSPGLLLIQVQYIGSPPAAPTPLTAADSLSILPQQTAILTIGSEGNRHAMRRPADWIAMEGANLVLYMETITAPCRPCITYVQNLGGAGSISTGNP